MLSGEHSGLRHRYLKRNQSLSAATVLLFTYSLGSSLHMFRTVYAELHTKWTSDQWWWGQCTDMQFYEKVQAHMDICDQLQIVSESSLKWTAAQRVLRASVSVAALLRSLAIFAASAAVVRLILAGGYVEYRRHVRRRAAPRL